MAQREAMPMMGAAEWGMLAALSVLWGGSFFFFKILASALPTFTIVMGRVGIAALILNVLLVARHDAMPSNMRLWGRLLVMGALNNVIPFTLIAFAETRISSGLAAILNATTPLFTILAAHFLTIDEKLNGSKAAGVMIGFLGVATLIGPSVIEGIGRSNLVAEAACLLAAVSYAFAGLYGRGLKALPPLKVATGQMTASSIILLPLACLVDRPWTLPMPGAQVWLALAGIALLSTALAYLLYFRILASAGATNLLLVTLLLPVSAMMLGVLVLGETITSRPVAGMVIVALGLAAMDGRPWRTARATIGRRHQFPGVTRRPTLPRQHRD